MARKSSNSNSGKGSRPAGGGFSIKREGQAVENQAPDLREIEHFAKLNPEMFSDEADSPVGMGSSKPISRVDSRSKVELSSKKRPKATKANQKNNGVDFSIFDQALSDQDRELNDSLISSGPTDRENVSDSSDPTLAKAKSRYGHLMSNKSDSLYLSEDDLDEDDRETFSLAQAELVGKVSDKRQAKLKALELEVLGFKTEIEEDFNGEYFIYRLPTDSIAFEDKDETFRKIGSGVYIDGESGVWYFNIDKGTKFLVNAGSLSEVSITEKPENYDFIKAHTPPPENYKLEGCDIELVLSHPSLLSELGIDIVDKEAKVVSLFKYSRQEVQQIFLDYGISALITEIYKTL